MKLINLKDAKFEKKVDLPTKQYDVKINKEYQKLLNNQENNQNKNQLKDKSMNLELNSNQKKIELMLRWKLS